MQFQELMQVKIHEDQKFLFVFEWPITCIEKINKGTLHVYLNVSLETANK